jgi:hypothetical protein
VLRSTRFLFPLWERTAHKPMREVRKEVQNRSVELANPFVEFNYLFLPKYLMFHFYTNFDHSSYFKNYFYFNYNVIYCII